MLRAFPPLSGSQNPGTGRRSSILVVLIAVLILNLQNLRLSTEFLHRPDHRNVSLREVLAEMRAEPDERLAKRERLLGLHRERGQVSSPSYRAL